MPFKIVQTQERGHSRLSIVPSFWEARGILSWPPKGIKHLSKLIRDENSKPGPGWVSLECVLKRNNIQSYAQADIELNVMEQNPDTDYQENEQLMCSAPLGPSDEIIDFEALVQEVRSGQSLHNNPDMNTTIISMNDIEPVEQEVQIFTTENNNMSLYLDNQTTIINKLDVIVQNQKKIAKKIISLGLQMDDIEERFSNPNGNGNVTLLKNASPEENESFSFTPIKNRQEFEKFEETLHEKTQKNKLRKFFSILCTSSPGQGKTCAYKLLDLLMAREFLCECSWSGGSKGELSKVPLKDFKNFTKFFFDIIRSWDPEYTITENEEFFKVVLRNATKRKAMKGLRSSSKRVRKEKITQDKKDSHEENSVNVVANPAEDNVDNNVVIENQIQVVEGGDLPT